MYTQEVVCPHCGKMTNVNVLESGAFFGGTYTTTPCAHCKSRIHVNVNSQGKVKSITSGCFIATAVYGCTSVSQVRVLQEFRDLVLARSGAGRSAIKVYYRYSPPAARFIASRPVLRKIMRVSLVEPAVTVAKLIVGLVVKKEAVSRACDEQTKVGVGCGISFHSWSMTDAVTLQCRSSFWPRYESFWDRAGTRYSLLQRYPHSCANATIRIAVGLRRRHITEYAIGRLAHSATGSDNGGSFGYLTNEQVVEVCRLLSLRAWQIPASMSDLDLALQQSCVTIVIYDVSQTPWMAAWQRSILRCLRRTVFHAILVISRDKGNYMVIDPSWFHGGRRTISSTEIASLLRVGHSALIVIDPDIQ